MFTEEDASVRLLLVTKQDIDKARYWITKRFFDIWQPGWHLKQTSLIGIYLNENKNDASICHQKCSEMCSMSADSVGEYFSTKRVLLLKFYWDQDVGFSKLAFACAETSFRAKPFIWKWVYPTGSFAFKSDLFSYERFSARTRFKTVSQGNSEMAYLFGNLGYFF